MSGKRTSADMAMNVIIAVVIIVVLGLGVWAVAPKISENLKNRETATENAEMQSPTVGEMAATEGISFEEYVEKYGLAEAELTAEDDFQTALYSMTLENFAKATGVTTEEVMSQYQLPESVTADTIWGDAMLEMPASVALGGEEQFAQAKEAYGLGDEYTADSRWGDVQNAMIQAMVQQQAEASAAPESTDEAAETAAPEATETSEE